MKIFAVEKSRSSVSIATAPAGRALRATSRFALALPVATLLLFGFYMLDLLGPKPFDTERTMGYLLTSVGLGALFALAYAIAGALRTDRWSVDTSKERVEYETRVYLGPRRGVEVPLESLQAVRIVRRGFGQKSTILFDFGEEIEEIVATRLGFGPIDDAASALEELLASRDIPVEREG